MTNIYYFSFHSGTVKLSTFLGATVTLDCQSPIPNPHVTWSRQGNKPLPANSVKSGTTLKILDFQPRDGGVYICEAKRRNYIDSKTIIDIRVTGEISNFFLFFCNVLVFLNLSKKVH